jgi:hypothetical protein
MLKLFTINYRYIDNIIVNDVVIINTNIIISLVRIAALAPNICQIQWENGWFTGMHNQNTICFLRNSSIWHNYTKLLLYRDSCFKYANIFLSISQTCGNCNGFVKKKKTKTLFCILTSYKAINRIQIVFTRL